MTKIEAYSVDLNKALLFIFISVVITMISVWGFIVPLMKEYKLSKIENRHAKVKFTQANDYYKQKLEELKNLNIEARDQIESLGADFDLKHFKVYLSSNMSIAEVQFQDFKEYETYFKEGKVQIKSVVPKPDNLFNSIISMAKYKNLIGIDFPIKVASKDSRELEVEFNANIYTVGDLNSTYDTLKNIK